MTQLFTDLHIHSRYSRGTSKKISLDSLARGAKTKGIDILGTGDFTHPKWLGELKANLTGSGLYSYDNTNFMLSTELSLIYTKNGTKKVHFVLLAPSFDIVDQINEWLDTKGRRDYDGRPIFGFSSEELVEQLVSISKNIEIIPAHIWTPWFSLFGSKSGFDSLDEAFGPQKKHIHALETGLSSDPEMNWRLSQLDSCSLVSNSDAHSHYPWRLGREATVLDLKEPNYKDIIQSIREDQIAYTIEVDPSYGKYHLDGHRKCDVCLEPSESNKLNKKCPKCGHQLTIGVLNRVEELADRPRGYQPENRPRFKRLMPLHELIATSLDMGIGTKTVAGKYKKFIEKFGSEYNVLINTPASKLEQVDRKLAQLIMRNRTGKIKVKSGYDGVYGKPILKQEGLGEFV